MSVTVKRGFAPGDRYLYDFELMTAANGWAQLDTSQDASYYGQWVNPTRREIFCYCEGDTILTICGPDDDLVREVAGIREWNREQGHRFLGIDPGFSGSLKESLITAGLGEFFHAAQQWTEVQS